MRPALKLVRSSQEAPKSERRQEIRYRFPAEEEVWEVSCDGMDEEKGRRSRPALRESRKAS